MRFSTCTTVGETSITLNDQQEPPGCNSYYSQDSTTMAFDCQTEKDVSRQRADSPDLIGRSNLWQLGLDLQPCC